MRGGVWGTRALSESVRIAFGDEIRHLETHILLNTSSKFQQTQR